MTALLVPPHPILGCLADISGALDQVADAQPVYLSTAEKATALRELAVLEARVAGLRLRVMAAADDVAEAEGARDVAAWFAHHTLVEPGEARADARLAAALDRDHAQVADALAAGRCSLAQARVIVQSLEELPDRVGQDIIDQAEATLVHYAADFAPGPLRRLGRRILEVVAPEVAEAEDARRLAAEERRARELTRLTLRSLGDGTTRLTGRLPDAAASRLRTYLEAFTSPRTEPSVAPEDRMPYPRRLGQGFCALLEHLDPAKLPHHGGDATTVIVTLSLDQLRAELATAGILEGGFGRLNHRARAQRRRARAQRRRGRAQRRRGPSARLHRPADPGGPRREVRGPGPGPQSAAVHPGSTQGPAVARPALPGRWVHDPGDLVRGPPPHTLGARRAHRPQRWRAAVQPSPPPRPRPPLCH